ncbi:MAG: ATP-binding protein [Candidatus Omnitrophota bacterium]|nr:ATP-binding protein [Candidatus Omnitrophota bacterium]
MESEIKEAYEELKRTQEQLVEAEKMKVIGGLASGIAHEVKNPLATILYGITYLSDNIDFQDKKVDMVLANIKEAVHRASKIITDLLNFSNINKLEKHMENLNQLIDKSLQLTQFQMDKHHIEVIKSFDRTLPKVRVDPNRIEQVLLNLIMNAVAAMPKGGQLAFTTYATQMTAKEKEKDLRLKSNGFKDGQEVVIISLEDTGCGIPQEQINNIFNPFFTTHRSQGGVGLGLTVSRNIMETHGGKIFLENRKKGGARATLIFKV